MNQTYQSLSHSKWDCKYHVVFVPKRRRQVLYGELRRQLGPIFHELARQRECQILEGHLRADHVHRVITIPPQYALASVIGFLKGKSAVALARLQGKAPRDSLIDVKGEKLKIMDESISGGRQRGNPDGSGGKNSPGPSEQFARSGNQGEFLGFATADESVIEVMQGIVTAQSA
jgi:putative transposase